VIRPEGRVFTRVVTPKVEWSITPRELRGRIMRKATLLLLCLVLVCPVFASETAVGRTTTRIHLRCGPEKSADSITVLRVGDQLEILQERDDWFRVRVRRIDAKGWVHGRYVRVDAQNVTTSNVDQAEEPMAATVTDDPYRGIIACKWVLDKYPIADRLKQVGLTLTRGIYECVDDPGYVLLAFGNEVSLAYLKAAIRAFSTVENAYIASMGPDPQYQGAILVGYQKGDKQRIARLSDVAEAIGALDPDEIKGVDDLAPVRELIKVHQIQDH